mgnify:CR=1 FL=1
MLKTVSMGIFVFIYQRFSVDETVSVFENDTITR